MKLESPYEEFLATLKFCPVCAEDLQRHQYPPLRLSCRPHGDFAIPSPDQLGLPLVWTFISIRKNPEDAYLLDRLHYCPFCKDFLSLNPTFKVKNCPHLHGDFRVTNGKATLDYVEHDYDFVRPVL